MNATNQQYYQMLEQKFVLAERTGFSADGINAALFPHQADAVNWACERGRGLIAMSFGLGKTRIQIEIARIIAERTGRPFLVICPLGVKHQFADEDGPALGTTWEYVRTDAEFDAASARTPFLLTNYERVRDGSLTQVSIDKLAGVSLDEGSVLRSMSSKTSDVFRTIFRDTEYRFVATATPSPNDYKELIYYADFLSVMDGGQALTRFFKRDANKAGNLRLMASQEGEFWKWVASWALFLYTPSDLGYSDDGYDLPALDVHWHRVSADQTRAWGQVDNYGQRKLFLDAAAGVTEASQEKHATLPHRVEKMLEILSEGDPADHWLLWHDLEVERRAIEKAVPEARTVYGSQELEEREQRIIDFSHGKYRILATKPEIAGSGCNFQYFCNKAIFLGVGYKFQDFIQAIHRIHRFLQEAPVEIHIIYADSEDQIVNVLKAKWQQHERLQDKMRSIIQTYGLSHEALKSDLRRSIGVERSEFKGRFFTAVRNDTVLETDNLPDNSVDLIHTSIPFGNHYEYSTHVEDFGHNRSDENFWQQMDYLIPKLLRVLKPGRVAAIHVKDRVLYSYQTRYGFMEIEPFSDDCARSFIRHGFMYEGRRQIQTDVVRENNTSNRLGYSEVCKDATKMGCGLPEYILLFRKPPTEATTARADEPVVKEKQKVVGHKCPSCTEVYPSMTGIQASDKIIGGHICPKCGEHVHLQAVRDSGYSRARWQIDAHSFWRSSGDSLLLPDELYDYETHVERLEALESAGALPATFFLEPPKSTTDLNWDDVNLMQTLNSDQFKRGEELHVCPLPFDIVARIIRLYSNENDLVLDPFAGLFTVPYVAVKLGRRGYGVELSDKYYQCGLAYMREIEQERMAPTLFDWLAKQQHSVVVSAQVSA